MKKIKLTILILLSAHISGCCSLPSIKNYSQLYSLTKETKKIPGTFGKKVILIKDFRENEMYEEDITALKEKTEKYISEHADLNEQAKNNLRELKVTAGAKKDEVKLLLGEPDKIIQAGDNAYAASEIWIYRTSKKNIFTVVFLPIFPTPETYYLYFKADVLAAIERHYLKQTFESSGIGLNEKKSQ